MPKLEVNAYAKINLSLEVTRKRDDGYHDIVSLMQTLELHDTLSFSPADRLELECSEPELAGDVEQNLAMKAARVLQEASGVKWGAHIVLHKAIPVASGLGGGSSDAAATLRGLTQFWGVRMARGELHYLATKVGSDVPFFLAGSTAVVEGRGEIVTPVSSVPPCWVVLVCPEMELPGKTARLYASLEPTDLTSGGTTTQLVGAISRGKFPSPNLLHNAFERAALASFGGLQEIKRSMQEVSGRDVHLSGSGPAMYILYPEGREAEARRVYKAMQSQGQRAFLTRTLSQHTG